ncbi:MAG: CRTAC1 family protein [Pseudomonadota bacterium]
MRRIVELTVLVSTALIAACGGGGGSGGAATPPPTTTAPPQPPPPTVSNGLFADRTANSGIAFTVGFDGAMSNPEVPFIVPSGAAAGDYDGDGDIDLFIVRGNKAANVLYRNDGNMTFTDTAAAAGVAFTKSANENYRHNAPAFADLDGDDDLDIVLAGLEFDPTMVYRNNGDGSFTDVTVGSGLDQMAAAYSMSTALGDYDRDGDLDLAFGHWGTPRDYVGGPGDTEHLWRNDSANGVIRFTSVSEASGIAPSIITNADPNVSQRSFDHTFTPIFADINDDDYPDLLMVGDFNFSQVFLNNQDGTFRNATDFDVIIDGNGMGAAVGDYDGDGDLDWFVSSILAVGGADMPTHLSRIGNRLYRNDGGVFADATDQAGVASGGWGWGSCFIDFENDGDLDIYHTNGWQDFEEYGGFPQDESRAFVSAGDGTFEEQAAILGLNDSRQGRGVICADFDGDGDADILQLHMDDTNAASLYENTSTNNFLSILLRGNAPNTQAIGATITATVGATSYYRQVTLGSNFSGHNPTTQLLGLATQSQIDVLTVRWPDGQETVVQALAANQHLVIDHPDR